METQSVVYIGPARPGVVIGDPYNRASIEAAYGVPVAVPAEVAAGLLAQQRAWATPERALELGVHADVPAPDAVEPQEPQGPVVDAPPAAGSDSTADLAVEPDRDRKRGDRP